MKVKKKPRPPTTTTLLGLRLRQPPYLPTPQTHSLSRLPIAMTRALSQTPAPLRSARLHSTPVTKEKRRRPPPTTTTLLGLRLRQQPYLPTPQTHSLSRLLIEMTRARSQTPAPL